MSTRRAAHIFADGRNSAIPAVRAATKHHDDQNAAQRLVEIVKTRAPSLSTPGNHRRRPHHQNVRPQPRARECSERATRLCTSPTTPPEALERQSTLTNRNRSKRACVGCSCHPPPALITEDFTEAQGLSRTCRGAARLANIRIASILRAVSSKVSFDHAARRRREVDCIPRLSRFAATWNEVCPGAGPKEQIHHGAPLESSRNFLDFRPVTSLERPPSVRSTGSHPPTEGLGSRGLCV
jgi:hypothetical protein